MRTITILTLIAICFCSCNKKNVLLENPVEEKFQTIKFVPEEGAIQPFDITPFLDTIKYVKLQLTEESIIGMLNKVVIYENRIYILDMKTSSLFVYNMDGSYLFKIAKVGLGPGEYLQLDFFDIDPQNKQIVLTDLMSYWIMRYDMDGNFISRHKIPVWVDGVAPIFDEGYVLYANFINNSDKLQQEYNLLYTDKTMEITHTYFPYTSTGKRIRLAIAKDDSFYLTGSEVLFFFPLGNCVYQVTPEGLSKKYQFDFGKYTFDSSYLNKLDELDDYLKKGDFNYIINFKMNDQVIFFSMYSNIMPTPAVLNMYYSKQSGNIISSYSFVLGSSEHYFDGYFKTGYESWIVSELRADDLLRWKESIEKRNKTLDNKFVRAKKAIADEITIDDNSLLMFYKLKNF